MSAASRLLAGRSNSCCALRCFRIGALYPVPCSLYPVFERSPMAKATFAAGCFWGVEAQFQQLPGVTATAVGYEGGQIDKPTYHDVCTDQTGHAEAVEIDYDPAQIGYTQLLEAFFSLHD